MTISRRSFLGAAAAVASIGLLPSVQAQTPNPNGRFLSRLYKARIIADPTDQNCADLKAAGFDGMEISRKSEASISEARQSRSIVEKHGLRIHSLLGGWKNFNIPDQYDTSVESVKSLLRVASAYGADALLLVPGRIGEMKMPDPWDFDINFDPLTLKIKSVVAGDNAPYADYIATHNAATEAAIRAVGSLIPVAAKEGVRIALENVWNNLWCTPKFFAAFCKYFDNPWVGCYFDLGNHIKYARCEEWIKELGSNIVKLHIKGFEVTEVKGKLGGGPGDWCRFDQASIDWKSVRKLLADIRYSGWVTIEETRTTDEEYGRLLDQVIAV